MPRLCKIWITVAPLLVMALGQSRERLDDFANGHIMWNCNFELNACHFRNQYNLAPFSRYYNPSTLFFDRKGLLVLDLTSPKVRRFPGARLITHYFPARYSNACLYISYRMKGAGSRSFYVIQQDKENKCLYSDESLSYSSAGQWKNIELQLDLTDGDPRFFLETHFESSSDPGYFAIGNFTFGFGRCRDNSVNNCNSYINYPAQPTAA